MLVLSLARKPPKIFKLSFPKLRRPLSTKASVVFNRISQPWCRYQLYASNSNDPFLNLSIEHHLLQSTHPQSTVLFIYVNRPCIVIGRNQNPWLEVNLGDTLTGLQRSSNLQSETGQLDVVRRRSGGGTVFHDHGNVNFSIICPPDSFTRDKHAEMVVRAIRKHNPRARVNERHDIVLDTGSLLPQSERPTADDTHRTAYNPDAPLKISGSAYKLTRTRALHHGTCLVDSSNVGTISHLLRSPLVPFVKARGIDSVKSPVGNAFASGTVDAAPTFKASVIREFCKMYGIDAVIGKRLSRIDSDSTLQTFDDGVYGLLGDEMREIEAVEAGLVELMSPEWLYHQTPLFTFSTRPTSDDPRPRPPLPSTLPTTTRFEFTARGGCIASAEAYVTPPLREDLLVGRMIHSIVDWKEVLQLQGTDSENEQTHALGDWLNELFGRRR